MDHNSLHLPLTKQAKSSIVKMHICDGDIIYGLTLFLSS